MPLIKIGYNSPNKININHYQVNPYATITTNSNKINPYI